MAAKKPTGLRDRSHALRVNAARGILLLTIVSVVAGLIVYWRAWSYRTPIGYGPDLPAFLASDLFALSCATIGLVILLRAGSNLVGWLLAALGLVVSLVVLGLVVAAVGLARAIEPSTLVGWLAGTAFQPVLASLVGLLMLVYPSGRMSPRCRRVAVVIVTGAAIRFVEIGWASGTLFYFPMRYNTYAPGGGLGSLIDLSRTHNLGLLVMFSGLLLATICVVVRYREAGAIERLQLRAFAASSVALLAAAALLLQLFIAYDPFMPVGQMHWVVFFSVASLYPITIGFAITRYRLYEIDRIINRAFVYGTLTAILAGMFTASVTLSQKVFVALTGESSDMVIVLTTLVAAASYTPVRKRLEALAERGFKYDSPRFGAYRAQLRSTLDVLDPAAIGDQLANEAMDGLRAQGAMVEIGCGPAQQVVQVGEMSPGESVLTVDLPGRTGSIGRLLVAPRGNGVPYRQDEIDAITEVAALAARAAELHVRPSGAVRTDATPRPRTREPAPRSRGSRRGVRRPRLAVLGGGAFLGEPIPPQPLGLMPTGRRSMLDPDS